MTAYSGFVVPERDARRHVSAELDWLAAGVVIASRLGTAETTAIVHPRAFTTAMMNAAQSHGAEVRRGRVTGIVRRADGSTVGGVEADGGVIEADAVGLRCPNTAGSNIHLAAFTDHGPIAQVISPSERSTCDVKPIHKAARP